MSERRAKARLSARRKAAKLLFDAVQAFATLKLDYDRAVALADLARSLRETGRRDQAGTFRDEARAIAERLRAVALRTAIEQIAITA